MQIIYANFHAILAKSVRKRRNLIGVSMNSELKLQDYLVTKITFTICCLILSTFARLLAQKIPCILQLLQIFEAENSL